MRQGKSSLIRPLVLTLDSGFMYGTSVLDKDGVSAAAALAQFAIHLEMEGKTLSSKLNELYEK